MSINWKAASDEAEKARPIRPAGVRERGMELKGTRGNLGYLTPSLTKRVPVETTGREGDGEGASEVGSSRSRGVTG